MARMTYVLRDGELVPKHLAAPLHDERAAPYVISDGMDPIRSQADGRIYDSKSQYERSVRAHGAEIVGNSALPPSRGFTMPSVREDMRRAIEQLGG